LLLRRLPEGFGLRLHPFHRIFGERVDHHGRHAFAPARTQEWPRIRAQFLRGVRQPGVRRRAGQDSAHTIYAGTLDDTSLFKPAMAINTRFKPDWVILPPGLTQFERMPQGRG
jgi:hypothetical protein